MVSCYPCPLSVQVLKNCCPHSLSLSIIILKKVQRARSRCLIETRRKRSSPCRFDTSNLSPIHARLSHRVLLTKFRVDWLSYVALSSVFLPSLRVVFLGRKNVFFFFFSNQITDLAGVSAEPQKSTFYNQLLLQSSSVNSFGSPSGGFSSSGGQTGLSTAVTRGGDILIFFPITSRVSRYLVIT